MIQEPLQQEILMRIDRLAEKLGVTAEYLWPHLVRYEVAQGVATIVCTALFAAIAALFWWFAGSAKINEDLAFGIALVMTIVAVVLIIVSVTMGIPNLIAPEAVAFKALLP